ncbi:hypothetical protein, variant 4 [Aphanomyces astaci]|uniref:Palmitoyltransferase n=1 Tax=Aphanomyces astaci TaxID=112090 RepID=W4G432_APHAT|nr:hypothetical protein, variant 4 [Aphanomyces astaci]ETV74445.1 hypothetical protein, variant 4 [Aphanomyces astaci]|eukprot:XP_009836104.1 hypothetical protein, variant 4 [Aphanomyces astaci]
MVISQRCCICSGKEPMPAGWTSQGIRLCIGVRTKACWKPFGCVMPTLTLLASTLCSFTSQTGLGRRRCISRLFAGESPIDSQLNFCIGYSHAEIVAFLVDEVNVAMEGEDDKGRTPLALARSKGHGAAAAVLQTRLYRRRSVLRLIRHALRSRFPRLVRRLPIVFQATNLLVVPCWYGGVFSRYDGLATAMTWHSVLLAVTWFFFGCAAWLDPGTVAHDRKYVEEYTTTMQRCLLQEYEGDDASNLARNQGEQPLDERLRRFCHTCHVAQPRRSKHCNVCHRCVLLFDHHCPFLGTCVGRNNYTFFLAFTICMSIAALSLAWMWYTTWMHMDPEATLWCVLAASYYTLVGLCAAGLFIFHLVLAAKNRTTHEFRAAGCTFNETDDLHRESGSWRQNYLGRLCVSVYHYVDMIKTQRPQHRKHVKVEIDHRRDYV